MSLVNSQGGNNNKKQHTTKGRTKRWTDSASKEERGRHWQDDNGVKKKKKDKTRKRNKRPQKNGNINRTAEQTMGEGGPQKNSRSGGNGSISRENQHQEGQKRRKAVRGLDFTGVKELKSEKKCGLSSNRTSGVVRTERSEEIGGGGSGNKTRSGLDRKGGEVKSLGRSDPFKRTQGDLRVLSGGSSREGSAETDGGKGVQGGGKGIHKRRGEQKKNATS